MKHIVNLSAALLFWACATGVAAQAVSSKPGTPTRKTATKTARPAPPSKEASLTPPANQEQLDAAERTHFGDYECEFDQKIHISLHPKEAGYIEVKHLKKVFTMRPIMSSTGALRLEDVRGQTLLLQIANKSMLMDVKAGRRIVDSCTHATQREFMQNAPPAAPVLN